MTPKFLRRYYVLRIISNPASYGLQDNFTSLEQLQQALVQIRKRHQEDILYNKLEEFSRKTINRDLKSIESFYDVVIKHKRGSGFYLDEIAQNDRDLKEVFEKTELYLLNHHVHTWKQHITKAKTSLSNYVDIVALINAVDLTYLIYLEYDGWYEDNKFQTFKGYVQPLHIKEINNQWYLLAYNHKIGIQAYCLDNRIRRLDITTKISKNPIDFNEKEYFSNSIGILKTTVEPQWIFLKVANHHYKYMHNNPICKHQVCLEKPKKPETELLDYNDPDMWGTIKIFVEPNYEFVMEILKYNLWVKVTGPANVKHEIKYHLELMMAYYD